MIAALVTALLLQAQPAAGPERACDALPGLDRLLARSEGRALLLGERHGSMEAPQVAAQLVCLALNAEPVVLALEISAAEQDRLDAYMASDGGAEAREALMVGSGFWDSDIQDGRSSAGLIGLIEAARRWNRAGLPVSLLAADKGPADGDLAGPQPRDQAMARNLEAELDSGARVIMLVGNVHARRTPARFGDRTLETVGTYMAPERVWSVNLLGDGGASWVCLGPSSEDIDCGAAPVGEIDIDGAPRVLAPETVAASPDLSWWSGAYDSIVYLGPLTVAGPAIAELRVR